MSTKPRGTPWTEKERRFVRDAYPALSPAAIAKKLHRSRSGVYALIERMKESGEIVEEESVHASAETAPAAPPPDAEGRQDTLGRLRWVRGLLERQLYDAEPSQAARLAKEYRDTVESIEKLESAEGGGCDDELGNIVALVARKFG